MTKSKFLFIFLSSIITGLLVAIAVTAWTNPVGNPTSGGGALYYSNGKVGIGDTTPASLLTVGSGDLFQVNSSGNIIKINNITYSWPSAQGAASTFLQNNGSGTLSWAPSAGGGIGGSGTTTQVAFFTGATAIGSDSNLYWNNTNKSLGISGQLDMSSNKIINVLTPTANNDVANKAYVDAQVTSGSAFEISCGWITTGMPPAVGTCTPNACPAGYTSSNVGCEVTSLASGGMYSIYGQGGGGAPVFGPIADRMSNAGAAGKCKRTCYK